MASCNKFQTFALFFKLLLHRGIDQHPKLFFCLSRSVSDLLKLAINQPAQAGNTDQSLLKQLFAI